MLFATLLLSLLLGATISVESLTEERANELKAQIAAIDGNNDGCLTLQEYITGYITHLPVKLSDEEIRQGEEQMRPIMEQLDQDGNGCITFEESIGFFG